MGDMRRRARRVVVVIAAGLALDAAACGGAAKTVAAGYPAVEGSGANFDLTVDGTKRTDGGGNGAYLMDDAVAAKRHYQIAATDTRLRLDVHVRIRSRERFPAPAGELRDPF